MVKKRILVIDDEKEDLIEIKRILKKANYSVSIASSGKSALRLTKNNNYDLILLDILMPNLSGYDVLRLFRQGNDKDIKIAYISIVPKIEVVMDGADGFIKKPFSPDYLLNKVSEFFKKSKIKKSKKWRKK